MVKLVRDKIPEIIEKSGKKCIYHIANEEEYKTRLYEKMREELEEFIEDPSVEEAADMYEVFLSILRLHDLDICDAIFEAANKKDTRGGFLERVILDGVGKE